MSEQRTNLWKEAVLNGLLSGAIIVLIALIGMITTFSARDIVTGVFTLGQLLYLAPFLLFSYLFAQSHVQLPRRTMILSGGFLGLMGGLVVALLVGIGQLVNLRTVFINASSQLYDALTFGVPLPAGLLMPLVAGVISALLGIGMILLPVRWRRAVLMGLMWMVLLGMLRDLLVAVISRWGVVRAFFAWLFAQSGLSLLGALVVFVLATGLNYWLSGRRADKPQAEGKPRNNRVVAIVFVGVLLLLPVVFGVFFSEILDNVGLYILMGLGLNIVVGYAGLLDLGYVAFFAIGAYSMGVLTSPELGFFGLTFWEALPIALGVSVLAGVILGLPVLRMRGDYLAIVTLGFGEIIRIIVLSDWLRPYLGGTQGIQRIAQPKIGPIVINTQQEFYYLILAGIAIAAFVAWRLKDSRLGRSWMALREDEDVAQAMGINLVVTKLMAFAVGALFSGLAGTLFAAKLNSAYPHSFNLLVSINVLCLIIVGGIGSIPGVFVGALALIGLPDLLREFAEFRYLVYGAVLVAMMLLKPEGLWPEARRKLELHESDEVVEVAGEVLAESSASSTMD